MKRRRKRKSPVKKYKIKKSPDKVLILLIFGLLIFGILMIYDSTVVYSQQELGGAYKLVLQQIGWVIAGLVGFFFFLNIKIDHLRKLAFPLFATAFIFLVILAFSSVFLDCSVGGFTPCINGARRWFYLNPSPLPQLPIFGVLGFQPSEFAKLALIIYLSVILDKHVKQKSTLLDIFIVFLTTTGIISGLILLQPNMSTAALIFAIGLSIYFVAEVNLYYLLIVGPMLLLGGIGMIFSSPYRRERLLTLIKPSTSGDLGMGYHIKQVLIALGSGGVFGVGFGRSRQKFQYLPEVAADSIFAVIGEELGFFGTTLFVIVFSLLVYKGYTIAKNSKDNLGKMLAVGITTWISLQFFINIAAMTRIIPLTGVPLPLVSYGGSSMIFSLMGLGILANISKDA